MNQNIVPRKRLSDRKQNKEENGKFGKSSKPVADAQSIKLKNNSYNCRIQVRKQISKYLEAYKPEDRHLAFKAFEECMKRDYRMLNSRVLNQKYYR